MEPEAELAPGEGALMWNPEVELIRRRRRGELRAVTVVAPRRGESLRITTLSRDREPDLFALAAQVAERARAVRVELDGAQRARLVDIGLLVPAGRIPARARFRGAAADLSAPSPAPLARERLRVDASLRYHDDLRPPDESRSRKHSVWLGGVAATRPEVNPLAEGCAWAFLDRPDAEVPGVVSVADRDRPVFRALVPGERPPEGLAPEQIAGLAAAGVLVDPEAVERRRRARAEARAEVKAGVARDHHAILRGLIHPAELAPIRRYYRDLIAGGHLLYGDRLVASRYWAHNEALARWLHRRLAPLLSEVAGKPMQPAFSFFASYRPGATFPPHVDRDPCELSLNVLLDHVPEPDGRSSWPLFLAGDDGAGRPVELALGDALFYRGRLLRHWRDPLPEGHAVTVVIFNYADAAYTGSLD